MLMAEVACRRPGTLRKPPCRAVSSRPWIRSSCTDPRSLRRSWWWWSGYLVARLMGKVLIKVSEKLGLQVAAERSGLAQSMRHMGIERNVPTILGTIGFWLLMCVFFMAAFNILGLTEVSTAMSSVAQYIPNLLVATVIVVVGLFAATFLRGVIATSTDRLGISYAEHLANGCYYTLALLTFILALKHLGIKFELLN